MSRLEQTSVQFLKGVGPARKALLENLGVITIEDLLYLFPRRYEDRRTMTPLKQLREGEFYTVSGCVADSRAHQSWYTRKHLFETVIADRTAKINCVWFNQPYLDRYFRPGVEVVLYGQVVSFKGRLQMVSPEFEIIDKNDSGLSMGRIVPIYPLTKGISHKYLRKIIAFCLDHFENELEDPLPVSLRNQHRLANIRRSMRNIHFPPSFEMQEEAHRRICFEEFFFFQISVFKRRYNMRLRQGMSHQCEAGFMEHFKVQFPFALTQAQERVIQEIADDMKKPIPMLRLLQGDVGSGKTLVAWYGALVAYSNRCQSALMAPTEVLARQHFENFKQIFREGEFKNIRSKLLTSSTPVKEREEILVDLAKGDIDVLISTQALLNEEVRFKNLSYVVIDEQHKFGVRQRAALSLKGFNPDVLVMTATPIPRTLCYTLFGDLDVSQLDEIPPGRVKTATQVLRHADVQQVYDHIRAQVGKGYQAYIVFPLIEESQALDLKAARASFLHLKANELSGIHMGLIHGQLKKEDAQKIMEGFKAKEIQVLVTTSILELGIDIKNATVIAIVNAERFGLAQLHQMRGRVGRGTQASYCYLISDGLTEDSQARFKAMLETTDGFKIAQSDLEIRGPGQYFGRHQHGLNELRFANPLGEVELLNLARLEAKQIIDRDPELCEGQNGAIAHIVRSRYPNFLELATSG